MNLKQLKTFFEKYEFPDDPLILDECTTITNQKAFVESHIRILEAQSGKKAFFPYYYRLLSFYKKIN